MPLISLDCEINQGDIAKLAVVIFGAHARQNKQPHCPQTPTYDTAFRRCTILDQKPGIFKCVAKSSGTKDREYDKK